MSACRTRTLKPVMWLPHGWTVHEFGLRQVLLLLLAICSGGRPGWCCVLASAGDTTRQSCCVPGDAICLLLDSQPTRDVPQCCRGLTVVEKESPAAPRPISARCCCVWDVSPPTARVLLAEFAERAEAERATDPGWAGLIRVPQAMTCRNCAGPDSGRWTRLRVRCCRWQC